MWVHIAAIVPLFIIGVFGIFAGIICIFLFQSVSKWYFRDASSYIKENVAANYKFSVGISGYAALVWLALILIGAPSKGRIFTPHAFTYIVASLFCLFGFLFLMTVRAAV